MSDERHSAADELKEWRIRYKEFLAANEAQSAFHLEESLRGDAIPEGSWGTRQEGYPLDADEAD